MRWREVRWRPSFLGVFGSDPQTNAVCRVLLWNGTEKLSFADVFHLDGDRLAAGGELAPRMLARLECDRCLDRRGDGPQTCGRSGP